MTVYLLPALTVCKDVGPSGGLREGVSSCCAFLPAKLHPAWFPLHNYVFVNVYKGLLD